MNALTRLRWERVWTRHRSHVLGWAAAFLVAAFVVFPRHSHWPHDYYIFWETAQFAASADTPSIYAAHGPHAVEVRSRLDAGKARGALERAMRHMPETPDLTASPFHYAVIRLLSRGDLAPDYRRFMFLSHLAYVGGILVLAALLGFPPWSFPLLVVAFTVPYWPFRRDVMDANDSAFLAGLVMLAMPLLARRTFGGRLVAGFIFGLLAAFKPTVAFLIVFAGVLVASGSGAEAVGFASGVVAAAGIAWMIAGAVIGNAAPWIDWFRHANHRAFAIRHIAGGLLGRYFRVKSPLWYDAVTAVTLTAGAVALWHLRRRASHRAIEMSGRIPPGFQEIAAAAAGLDAYLLCGMLVWGHYFTLAVPGALVGMRPRPHRADGGRRPLIVGLFIYALLAFHKQFRQMGWTDWGNYSPFTLLGTALSLAMALWDIADVARPRLAVAAVDG